MTIDYHDFNPVQYFSGITHVEGFQEGADSRDLQVELVNQKANEVFGILEDRGIEAKLTPGKEGHLQVRISRAAIDQLIACQKTLGAIAPLDVSPLVKAIKTPSLSLSDKKKVEAVLSEIRDNMSVTDLMKRSDLKELQSMFEDVYSKCSHSSGARRLINWAIFPTTSFEGICSDVLQRIGTAITEREEHSKRIFEALEQTKPDLFKIKAMFREGVIDINHALNEKGETALHIAARNGHDDLVRSLITWGADANKGDKVGNTPLHAAIANGKKESIVALRWVGGADVVWKNHLGETPLQVALKSGDNEIVQAAIDGSMYTAATQGNTEGIKILIDQGIPVNQQGLNLQTALHAAVINGKFELFEILLERGADINLGDIRRWTPLHHAACLDLPDAFLMLMSKGADIKKVDTEGYTPLQLALKREHSDPHIFMQSLIAGGYGPDLMRMMVQKGGSKNNIQALLHAYDKGGIDRLFPDLVPLVNFDYIAITSLIDAAKEDSIATQFLEALVKAKWSHPNLTLQPGINEFIVKMGEEDVVIPKTRFYELWIRERGDPERITESFLHPRQQPEAGAYKMRLVRDELQLHPEHILKTLSDYFQHSIRAQLQVEFEGEAGQDAGGLGRQFVGQLFSEIVRSMQFEKRDNGLFRPRLKEDSQGDILPLTESDKTTYRRLGQLMMFCLNAAVPYPVGMLLDQGVFTAIVRMNPKDLQKEFEEMDFNDPAIFSKMLSVYKEINRYHEDDVKMIARLERYLTPKSDSDLEEAYALVMQDPSIAALKINTDVQKMKQHQAAIVAAVRNYIVENNLRRTFAPIHEIAKGMTESPFNSRLNFKDVQRMDPVALSRTLQGTVAKEDILNKLQFEEEIPENIRGWFKKWIEQADDKKLAHFIFALSGSSALGRDAPIKIAKGGNIAFHTCFNTVDLNWYKNKETKEPYSEQELTKNLEWAIDYVQAHSGFDMA